MLLAQTTQHSINIADLVLPLIPWVLVFAFVWFVIIRLQRRALKTSFEHMERTRAHQAAVEQKLDRLIALAEQRNGQR